MRNLKLEAYQLREWEKKNRIADGSEPEKQRAAVTHTTAAQTTIAESSRPHKSPCRLGK